MTTLWQYGSSNPDNATHLDTIRQWWVSLQDQEIHWQQRLLPTDGDLIHLDWEPQKFDEIFTIKTPQVRGATLYWFKPEQPQERSITPHKLELDLQQKRLYIFPESQQQIVIRVERYKLPYQLIELTDPDLAVGKNGMILLRDHQQLIEVKINLSLDRLKLLKSKLSSDQ
ncbi:hypothetical protein [Planktothrix sp. FACHB-1365]|uniref:hypothetical protein n=1 Tax=Planktothrix sp. FACHB-1365 TaxID=2692855 RepID=UPI00168A3357|nr:hypothetical protein [Planktothrix sp. FACHB-1365]MBD2481519.1 hypothetical protein [Planktothrix sp. FACHB-1365]